MEHEIIRKSIFIPLESEDEENPIISELYPYKTLNDVNEDGYRYNLLPYKNSYNGHRATGTFFDRNDVLVDPNLIEVFDKYYKYTATTNDSGDFMLFGVPVGSHQIVMDVDLSDIGEFSLSPQDLIRMGIATEQEVAGTNFKVGEFAEDKVAEANVKQKKTGTFGPTHNLTLLDLEDDLNIDRMQFIENAYQAKSVRYQSAQNLRFQGASALSRGASLSSNLKTGAKSVKSGGYLRAGGTLLSGFGTAAYMKSTMLTKTGSASTATSGGSTWGGAGANRARP